MKESSTPYMSDWLHLCLANPRLLVYTMLISILSSDLHILPACTTSPIATALFETSTVMIDILRGAVRHLALPLLLSVPRAYSNFDRLLLYDCESFEIMPVQTLTGISALKVQIPE